VEHIPPDATQRILQEARTIAQGDARAVLALLQGCFLEEAIRVSIEEQPTERLLAAVHAFCSVAGHRLLDAATFYGRAQRSSEERLRMFLGRLHNAPDEAQRFAASVRNRLETVGLTRTPSDDLAESDDAPGELSDDAL
jgi:4-alpha-glucanotransferase